MARNTRTIETWNGTISKLNNNLNVMCMMWNWMVAVRMINKISFDILSVVTQNSPSIKY